MRRTVVAALAWAALVTGGLALAEEEPKAAPEPETTDVEAAAPTKVKKKPTDQGVEQVSETYVVKTGDTLWELSQKFLGNAWYWPKVWSYNPEIENPHWIYPGNVVRFFPSQDELPAQVEAGAGDDLPAAPAELADVSMGTLHAPGVVDQDEDPVSIAGRLGFAPSKKNLLRQDGFVTRKEIDDAGVIDRAWAEKSMLSTFDKVYIRFRNASAVRPGERYVIYRTIDQLKHPATGEEFGFLTHVVGTLRVVSIGKNVVTGYIEHTLEDIGRGDFVGPYTTFDKQILTKDNARAVTGQIVASLTPRLQFMGEHHVVFIDKGSKDGVEEGNVFSVVHQGDPLVRDQLPEEIARYPREEVAQIVVVDVKDTASAGLVVRSIRELIVGDRVEMVRTLGPASASR